MPGGASPGQPDVHPAAAVVARITEVSLKLTEPPLFGSHSRERVQRTPVVMGKPIAVVIPGDSAANQLHDGDLGGRIAEMVRGAGDVGQGVAALVAQHMPIDTTPSVPSPMSFSVQKPPSSSKFGAATGTGDIHVFGAAP